MSINITNTLSYEKIAEGEIGILSCDSLCDYGVNVRRPRWIVLIFSANDAQSNPTALVHYVGFDWEE